MNAQDLKNSILQLAVQGKLVEQRLEEGSAKELLEQIKAEKERLIKEKKIKKEKPLPEITEEEKPFEIPESWEWVRWGDLSYSIQYGYNAPALEVGKIKMVRISDIQDNEVVWDSVPYCNISDEDIDSYLLAPNDILFARTGGTVGKSYLVKEVQEKCVYAGYLIRTRYSKKLIPQYLKLFMESPLYWQQLRNGTIATAQPNCNGKTLAKMILPLPSLDEQKRIVAKIEEILLYIEQYDKAYTKLETFNKKFPSDMKKSILQLAMQGKLVEQRPEEGTGEELYQQIVTEKARLIKEGKIKKEKLLDEITEDEIPFDIPESWKWVRVGEVFDVGTGMTPLKSEIKFYQYGTIPWITSSLTSQRFIKESETYITEYALKHTSLNMYPAHTLIVAMYGQGKTRGQISELLIDATINQACAALGNIIIEKTFTSYVYYCFLFNYEILRKKAEGTSQPNLNLKKIQETLIPLPPLTEQKRIVTKLEQMLSYCDQLTK